MKLAFLLAFLSVISPILAWLHRCPPAENLGGKCSCERRGSDVLVGCQHINDTHDLSETLTRFQNYVLDALVIYDSGTLEMVQGPFNKLNIHRLTFRNVKFGLFPLLTSFKGLEQILEALTMDNCKIRNWKWSGGTAFSFLKNLTFKQTNLPEVLNSSFFKKFPSKVENLNVIKCGVKELGNNAFQKFTALRTLKIEDNLLTSFSRKSFPSHLSRLSSLSLRGNPLKELPNDIFTQMPRLEVLMLGGTQIRTLLQETFEPVWDQLEKVYFNKVRLNCDCNSTWLITEREKLKEPPICAKHNKTINDMTPEELCTPA